jgi:hypothetical protein
MTTKSQAIKELSIREKEDLDLEIIPEKIWDKYYEADFIRRMKMETAKEIKSLEPEFSTYNDRFNHPVSEARLKEVTKLKQHLCDTIKEQYLNQIEPELKQKAYVYWRDWKIKGMDWEDLAQDLRIHLSNKFDTWEKESSFRTWANRVMMNKINNIVRDKNNSKDVLDQKNTLSTEELLEKGLDINNYGEIVKEGE